MTGLERALPFSLTYLLTGYPLLVDEVLPVLDDDVRFIFQFVSRGGVDLSGY